ncbi:MAG TPA: thioredoxin family protein [Thermoanaerobaculaceae bacterium]|nr:thioredoxin family protein [Thermoanaerobaculaceae bacterium]HRS16423.1 thioredoxin family protein [Thermoanaerobaculaceae bacterium]
MSTYLKLLLIIGCLVASGTALAADPAGEIPALDPPHLDAALGAGKWLFVEFGGEHCIPCKAMQPILRDLQSTLGERGMVRNFWIQKHPETARRFRIMVMPTQVVFNPKGEEVLRHQGIWPAEELKAALAKVGAL